MNGSIPCDARVVATNYERGIMAIADEPNLIRIYKTEDLTRYDESGTHASWQLSDSRDLPSKTGARSKVTAMEFSPDGTQLFVTTSGRNTLTTLHIDDLGRVREQRSDPPATFKV